MVDTAVRRWWPDLPFPKLWTSQLMAESRCREDAVSPVGARGIAQFMPATWSDMTRRLDFDPAASPHTAKFAIPAGAAYMASLRYAWRRDRVPIDQHWLATASYNRGTGNIIKDQAQCGGARFWDEIAVCTARVTRETVDYVARIRTYWKQMEME